MQETPVATKPLIDEEDFSLKAQLQKVWGSVQYALGHWRILSLAAIAGILLGLGYAWWKPVTYTARTSFIVEDAKASGAGMLSALAGQFGFDVGDMAGGNGILAGDNILELLKSRTLIKKTLLTPFDSAGGTSLADVYADQKGWKEKWKNSSKVGMDVHFMPSKPSLTRLEDSLLQRIVKKIVEDELSVSKIDRKLSFIEMQVTMPGEMLSLLFSQRLLKTTTDFYVQTKTHRTLTNVNRLQAKADSLERMLNRKTYTAADANRVLLDANPAYAAPEVSAEISSRDKMVQSTIYAEIVKNLEVSKMSLIQETPTVQLIDLPETPLKKNRVLYPVAALAGAALAVFITGLIVVLLRRRDL